MPNIVAILLSNLEKLENVIDSSAYCFLLENFVNKEKTKAAPIKMATIGVKLKNTMLIKDHLKYVLGLVKLVSLKISLF